MSDIIFFLAHELVNPRSVYGWGRLQLTDTRFYGGGGWFTLIKTRRHDRQRWQAPVSQHIAEDMMCRTCNELRGSQLLVISQMHVSLWDSNRVEMWDTSFQIHRLHFTIIVIMDLLRSLFDSDISNFSDIWRRYLLFHSSCVYWLQRRMDDSNLLVKSFIFSRTSLNWKIKRTDFKIFEIYYCDLNHFPFHTRIDIDDRYRMSIFVKVYTISSCDLSRRASSTIFFFWTRSRIEVNDSLANLSSSFLNQIKEKYHKMESISFLDCEISDLMMYLLEFQKIWQSKYIFWKLTL